MSILNTHKKTMCRFFLICLQVALLCQLAQAQFPRYNLNVVIFTAGDLGPDGTGIGAFGAKIRGITPNIVGEMKKHNFESMGIF